jgi:UDP-N-acetylmuramoyl-L-alanyl-D-glutamate--2,6-diaminopimelate ligase
MKLDLSKFKGITADSRNVKPGYLFIAIKGQNFNGEDYVKPALDLGATMVLVSHEFASGVDIDDRIVKVKNPRQALAEIAAKYYDAQPENIAAVTGTNGKTSTVNFFRQICKLAGYNSASMGTLGIIADGISNDNDDSMTSPDPLVLHPQLALLYERGITHLGIEASSHGLSQYRLDGVNIKTAGFTNLTRDHLDYHDNMHDYFNAKARLFTDILTQSGTAVLNADIPEYAVLESICKRRKINIISYGKNAKHLKLLAAGKTISLEAFGKKYEEEFNLAGEFQYSNVLCAIGLAAGVGMDADEAIVYISSLKAAPGRMEKVACHHGGDIYIDYAHSPDALEKTLLSLRHVYKGKLYVVFGAGGDRDVARRTLMGDVATKFADFAIVTDDNPRTEDPAKIRREILAHCPNGKEFDNREKAIQYGVSLLKKGDALLIAGKGHETYQIIGTKKIYFSDHDVVKATVNYANSL